jgi:hypothetical protein
MEWHPLLFYQQVIKFFLVQLEDKISYLPGGNIQLGLKSTSSNKIFPLFTESTQNDESGTSVAKFLVP